MDMVAIGKNIKQLRINRGFNQDSIADFLGVDQSLVSKVEKGSRSLSADVLEKLAYLFGVTIDVLENGNIPEETLSYAFRGSELTVSDMETICAINKIALNLEKMNCWLEERSL